MIDESAPVKCPSCRDGTCKPVVVENFKCRFEAVEIVMPVAKWRECNSCGERLYSAQELKRRKAVKEYTLANRRTSQSDTN